MKYPRKIVFVLLGAVAAVSTLAVTSGGFPSRPIFQAIGIATTPNAAAGTITANSAVDVAPIKIKGPGTGATNTGVEGFYDSTNTRTGYVGDGSSGDSDITLACDTSPCNVVLAPTGTGVAKVGAATIATLTSGTYTATATGCTTSPTSTVFYSVIGSSTGGLVVLRANNPIGCTSNATSFTLTGAPAAIRPSTLDATLGALDGCGFQDNTVAQCGKVSVGMSTTGVLNFFLNNSSSGWTASGTKSSQVFTYAYPLQ